MSQEDRCDGSLSSAERRSEITRRLARWRAATHGGVRSSADDGCLAVAAVRADTSGWIALLDDGRLVASHADGGDRPAPSEAPEAILRALDLADGEQRAAIAEERDRAQRAVDDWITRDWARRSSGLEVVDTPLRRRVLRALDVALRATPRHRRAVSLGCAARLRRALSLPLPLGIERELDALAHDRPLNAEWIESADALLDRRVSARAPASPGPSRCRALILFGP